MRPLLAILFLSGAAAFAPARWARPLAPSQSSFCGAPHPALVARAPAAATTWALQRAADIDGGRGVDAGDGCAVSARLGVRSAWISC